MKRTLLTILILTGCLHAFAGGLPQDARDSVSVTRYVDSLLVEKDILDIMPSISTGSAATVTVNQSPEMADALRKHIQNGKIEMMSGYRIRIYFSNSQNARWASEQAAEKFSEKYPGYPVFRSFVNPNFKVTIGNFKTKSDALLLLGFVKNDFPAAFIVKEGEF